MSMRKLNAWILFCAGLLLGAVCGCSRQPVEVTGQKSANANAAVASAPPVAHAPAATLAPAGMGEPVNTAKFDAEISRLEKQAEKSPGDESARQSLARAYLARANALTGARQYRAALGDYRRTLRYDPDNEEAQQMAATIMNIMKEMGREVPKEGDEPAPLQLTPEMMDDDQQPEMTAPTHRGKGADSKKKQ